MTKWDYMIVPQPTFASVEMLRALGQDGWELAAADAHAFYLKRPIDEAPKLGDRVRLVRNFESLTSDLHGLIGTVTDVVEHATRDDRTTYAVRFDTPPGRAGSTTAYFLAHQLEVVDD